MNNEQIDILDGRELDFAIEQHIFGNLVPPEDDNTTWERLDKDGIWHGERQNFVQAEWQRSWSVVEWPPFYHDSDALAFQVVDKLNTQELRFGLEYLSNDSWFAAFSLYKKNQDTVVFGTVAKTRALAICRAALKVVRYGKQ